MCLTHAWAALIFSYFYEAAYFSLMSLTFSRLTFQTSLSHSLFEGRISARLRRDDSSAREIVRSDWPVRSRLVMQSSKVVRFAVMFGFGIEICFYVDPGKPQKSRP